jgi:cobalt-zinc-cadmium efflux system protein
MASKLQDLLSKARQCFEYSNHNKSFLIYFSCIKINSTIVCMGHEHDHSFSTPLKMNTAFMVGIILNFAFVLIEVIAGLLNSSLSLLSDAGHNLADVGALALSLLAFRLLKIKANARFTYGYRKTSILVALFNSVVLFISIGVITYEAIQRLFNPQPVSGFNVALIAGVGIVINFTTAIMFFRGKEHDLNIKSAYLHLMADALVSLAIVIGGIAMYYLQWFWIDPVLSIGVVLVILFTTWHLLKDSLRLSMDAVPENISVADVRSAAMTLNGVADLHHIHIWALSTTENALTAHLVLSRGVTAGEERKIKHELKHLLEHKNIHHVTLETERDNENCETDPC